MPPLNLPPPIPSLTDVAPKENKGPTPVMGLSPEERRRIIDQLQRSAAEHPSRAGRDIADILRERGLGFLTRPPGLGLRPGKFAEIFREEVVPASTALIPTVGKPLDVLRAPRSVGRVLYELAVPPFRALDKSTGAVVANALVSPALRGASESAESLGYKDLAKDLDVTAKQFERDRGLQEMLGFGVTMALPGIGLGPKGIVSLLKAPFKLPGLVSKSYRLGRILGAKVAFEAGTKLESRAPEVAKALEKPWLKYAQRTTETRLSEVLPQFIYKDPDTGQEVVGKGISRRFLENELSRRRTQLKHMEGRVPEQSLNRYRQNTEAIQQVLDTLEELNIPDPFILKGDFWEYVDDVANFRKALASHYAAGVVREQAAVKADHAKRMLEWEPSYTFKGSKTPQSLRRYIRPTLDRHVGKLEKAYADIERELAATQAARAAKYESGRARVEKAETLLKRLGTVASKHEPAASKFINQLLKHQDLELRLDRLLVEFNNALAGGARGKTKIAVPELRRGWTADAVAALKPYTANRPQVAEVYRRIERAFREYSSSGTKLARYRDVLNERMPGFLGRTGLAAVPDIRFARHPGIDIPLLREGREVAGFEGNLRVVLGETPRPVLDYLTKRGVKYSLVTREERVNLPKAVRKALESDGVALYGDTLVFPVSEGRVGKEGIEIPTPAVPRDAVLHDIARLAASEADEDVKAAALEDVVNDGTRIVEAIDAGAPRWATDSLKSSFANAKKFLSSFRKSIKAGRDPSAAAISKLSQPNKDVGRIARTVTRINVDDAYATAAALVGETHRAGRPIAGALRDEAVAMRAVASGERGHDYRIFESAAERVKESPAAKVEEATRAVPKKTFKDKSRHIAELLEERRAGKLELAEAKSIKVPVEAVTAIKTLAAKVRVGVDEANKELADKLAGFVFRPAAADPGEARFYVFDRLIVTGEPRAVKVRMRPLEMPGEVRRGEPLLIDPRDVDLKFVIYRKVAKSGPKDVLGIKRTARYSNLLENVEKLRRQHGELTTFIREAEDRRASVLADLKALRHLEAQTQIPRDAPLKVPVAGAKTRGEAAKLIPKLSKELDDLNETIGLGQERIDAVEKNLRAATRKLSQAEAERFGSYRAAVEDAVAKDKLFRQAGWDVVNYWQRVRDKILPAPLSVKQVGKQTFLVKQAVSAEDTVTAKWVKDLMSAHAAFLNDLRGAVRRQPIRSEVPEGIVKAVNKMAVDLKRTKFAQGMADIMRIADITASGREAANALMMQLLPWQRAEENLDAGALGGRGLLRFIRHFLLGTGQKTPAAEGIAATYFLAESSGALRAQLHYGFLYDAAAEAVVRDLKSRGYSDLLARKLLRVGGKNVFEHVDKDRTLANYIAHYAAKPIDDPEWQRLFLRISRASKDYALDDTAKRMIYDYVKGNFVLAALYHDVKTPKGIYRGLFNLNKIPNPAVRNLIQQYGQSLRELDSLARDVYRTGIDLQSLVKYDFRLRYGPTRQILPAPESVAAPIRFASAKPEDEIIAALAETLRRMNIERKGLGTRLSLAMHEGLPSAVTGKAAGASPTYPFRLEQVYLGPKDMAAALPASVLRSIARRQAVSKFSKYMRDARTGESLLWRDLMQERPELTKAHFKPGYEDMYGDWKKFRGMVTRDDPRTGIWKYLATARRFLNSLAYSVLVGDASIVGIQLPFLIAVNPRAGFRAAKMMLSPSLWDDYKFAAYMAANRDLLTMATRYGLGVGMEAYVGASFKAGNVWEVLPLIRPVGQRITMINDIFFNRLLLAMKLEAIKTNMHAVQVLRSVPPALAMPYIQWMPGLNKLNKDVDLLSATNEEVFRAIVRLVNNQFGGVPRSQSQIGVVRELFEQATLIVPGFFRARAGLISQMGRAVANPSSIEGWLAINLMGRELLYAAFVSGGLSAATGNFDQWLDKAGDPRTANFLSAFVGPNGERVSIFPSGAAFRLYSQMLGGYRDIKDPLDRWEAAKRFFHGRQNPVLSAIVQAWTGKDFWGRNRTEAWQRTLTGVLEVMPVIAAEIATAIEDQIYQGQFDPRELGLTTAAEFLGRSYRPASSWEALNNRFKAWQQRLDPFREPLNWNEANTTLREMAKESDPALAELEDQWLKDKQRRETDTEAAISVQAKQFEEAMAALDSQQEEYSRLAANGDISLAEWAEHYQTIGALRASKAEDYRRDLADLGLDLESKTGEKLELMRRGRGPLLAWALAEYDAVDMPYKRLETGELVPDFEKFEAEREAALAPFPDYIKDEVKRRRAPKDPIALRYKEAQADLDTYLNDIPKYVDTSVADGRKIDFYIAVLNRAYQVIRDSGYSITKRDAFKAALSYLVDIGKIRTRKDATLAARAYSYALDSNARLAARTRESLRFLIDNPDILRFFPWMIRELPNAARRLLPEDLRVSLDLKSLERQYQLTP